MKRSFMTFIAVSALCLTSLAAQTLRPSLGVPVADGRIAANEYDWQKNMKEADIAFSLSADASVLYVAFAAPTVGWVSVGLGSLKMDGAYMVLGSKSNEKTEISEDTGKGHRHTPNTQKILITQAVQESEKRTVLEFSVPAADFIKGGKLEAIAAWSKKDSFTSRHSTYLSFTVPVQLK